MCAVIVQNVLEVAAKIEKAFTLNPFMFLLILSQILKK